MSLRQASKVLGVHYMTAYRYERLGLLPAVQQGGAWAIPPADVEADELHGDFAAITVNR